MAKLRLLKFVQTVIGWRDSGMETHYQKQEYQKSYESVSHDCQKGIAAEDKNNIFKDVYSCIKSFNTLLYEAIKSREKS